MSSLIERPSFFSISNFLRKCTFQIHRNQKNIYEDEMCRDIKHAVQIRHLYNIPIMKKKL